MKLAYSLLAFSLVALPFSAFATNLHCEGSSYEISAIAMPAAHSNWENVAVKKNGADLLPLLTTNGETYILGNVSNPAATLTQIVNAVAVDADGVITSSLLLSIKLNKDGGYTGTGNAVIFDGTSTTTVNGLNCKTP
jgi:hypothetical protein